MSFNAPKNTNATEVARNLYSDSWTSVYWDTQQTLQSLNEIRKIVEGEAEKAIRWYYEKKRTKVWYSQWLRMLSVVLGSIGAAIPFISATNLFKTSGDVAELAILRTNQWGYVFILAAGTCVAMDKLFGFSTNWIRFVDAATKIETLLGRFRIEWYKQMALADIAGQPAEAIGKLFDTLLEFVTKMRDVIEKETGDWIVEFRSNLTKLAEDTKASQEAREKQIQAHVDQIRQIAKDREQKTGAVTVTVTNFAALGNNFTWSLELDNEVRKASIDRSAFIVKDLDPGTYLISARGVSNNVTVQDTQTVVVETNKSTPTNLTLHSILEERK
jgi:hypothetical protein